jgi:tetratricopeptide (TPR) repeat protein
MYSLISRKPQIHRRDSRLCFVWALLAVLLLFSGGSNAVAAGDEPANVTSPAVPESANAAASTHFETGLALYGLGHFEDAVSEFRKAYEVQDRPEFLLHIGRSFDQLGQSEKALYFFKRYLSTAPPQATEREEAKEFVRKFETEHPAEPTHETPAVITSTVPVSVPNEPQNPPLWQRWWVWTLVGVVVTASTVVGLALVRGSDDEPPQSDLGHMRF